MEIEKFTKKFMRDRRGVGGAVYVLIGLMVMLLVAVIVVNSLVNSQTPDDTWSAQANATWASIQQNIWIALGLCTVALIIIGAMAILSYLNLNSKGGGF